MLPAHLTVAAAWSLSVSCSPALPSLFGLSPPPPGRAALSGPSLPGPGHPPPGRWPVRPLLLPPGAAGPLSGYTRRPLARLSPEDVVTRVNIGWTAGPFTAMYPGQEAGRHSLPSWSANTTRCRTAVPPAAQPAARYAPPGGLLAPTQPRSGFMPDGRRIQGGTASPALRLRLPLLLSGLPVPPVHRSRTAWRPTPTPRPGFS